MTRAILLLFAALLPTTASALTIAPECKRMQDPLGCTCAVQNGGAVLDRKGGGKRWVSKRQSRAATNEAFVQCQIRAGRR